MTSVVYGTTTTDVRSIVVSTMIVDTGNVVPAVVVAIVASVDEDTVLPLAEEVEGVLPSSSCWSSADVKADQIAPSDSVGRAK